MGKTNEIIEEVKVQEGNKKD